MLHALDYNLASPLLLLEYYLFIVKAATKVSQQYIETGKLSNRVVTGQV